MQRFVLFALQPAIVVTVVVNKLAIQLGVSTFLG